MELTTELWVLVYISVLALCHPFIYLAPRLFTQGGFDYNMSNRDDDYHEHDPGYIRRAIRAHRNLTENLVHYAALVIVCTIAGVHNDWTILGAQLFAGSRVVYLGFYMAGITPWRTPVYVVGMVGELIIASQLIF